ncbi:MAG: glycosyltransferase [Candidatus Hydrogenedentes bacterium]|nr:glycosyltransferase [Candidatus Hydrogenedentota bacterium]
MRSFRPNLVVCRWLRWAVATGGAFIPDIPVILDLDIVDWRVHGSQEEQMSGRGLVKRIHSQFYTRTIEWNARRRLRQFAHVWVVSEDDRQIIGGRSCSVLPNVPILPASDGQRFASEKPNQPNILFVGDLGFSSNAHGLSRFLERVWPRLHEAAPELKLRIVGRLPDGESASIARWRRVPNVELVGFVEDLGVEYERALFTVAPIYWGGGTKIKVIESLGRGKTCVVTPHSLYGLGPHVRHGESLLCAPSDAEFADACLNLTRSEDLRQRLALKGRHTIHEYFSVARFNDVVAETVQPFELPRE